MYRPTRRASILWAESTDNKFVQKNFQRTSNKREQKESLETDKENDLVLMKTNVEHRPTEVKLKLNEKQKRWFIQKLNDKKRRRIYELLKDKNDNNRSLNNIPMDNSTREIGDEDDVDD